MSQSGKYRKMMRKHAAEHDHKQDRYAYNILASKIVLGLALGCLSVFPSGIAYADEAPAEAEIKTKITAIDGQQSTIVKEDDLYKIYAQFVSDDGLGVNRFKDFSLGNGDRADMYFNMKDSTNYANTLVNMVNSEVNINGVLNAVKNGEIDGNLYFLSPDGIVVGSQGVINAGSFTGMVVQKDTFNELFKGEKNTNKSGEEFGLDEITALMASDEDSKPATTGNIEVSGHINTHSGIVLGAGVIDINDGAQLKSISNIQFENVVNSEIAQQIPQGLTASQRTDGSGDIVLKAASFKNVDDSELPALKATKVKDKDEYELKNWDKWEEGWLKELFAADNASSVTNKGKITTDGAVKISADANTSYKEGQIFEYLQDQRTKDLVQKKIRESIIKDAALRYGMYLYLKKTSGKDSDDLLKPDSSQWTKWIDLFLLGIMEGTGNRSNEASVSLGGTIEAESLDAKASANLTMDVNSSVMARAYTNVTGKNTSEVTVNKGLELKQGAEKIDAVTLAADTNTTILATARGLNVQRKEGDTTTKLPSVYGAVTIVNSESSANVKVNEEIDTAGDFKATANMQEDMEVTASSAMNEESGVLSAGVAYVNDKTSANVTINKDISASSIEVSANNTVAKDLMTVNNTLGVMSGQIFDGDTQPVELKPLDSSQKSSLNKFFDKLVDYGDELVGKLKKYGDAGATVGIFNQENSSSVEINAALEAINGNDENGDNKGNININAETMIGGTDDDGNQIGGFHMNVVNSMTHAKSSDGSAATTGALINAAVLVDNVKNNATVKIANAKESNENDDDANDEIDEIGENPVASLYASGSININAQAHMDYNPAAEGLYNVKEAWKQVKESYEAITNLPQDIKDAYKAALENWDENVKAIDWSDPTKIPSTLSNWEKLKEAIDKVKEDGELGLDIKARLISTAENALNLTHPSTYTHYHVRTESKNQSEDGSGNFTATGSVQVNELQNNAAVLIGEETAIKADGNTGIKAESGTYTVTLTGKGGEYGTLDQSGKVGMGASVAHQEINGTGLVMVGKNTIIEGNAIDINGVNNMKQVDIVYSSGKADTLNIGGMVNIVKGTGNSIVSIDDEATLTATGKPDGTDEGSNNGTINLHTENNTTINAITGGLTLGGQDAVGAVGIGVNYVDYNTNNIVQVADNGEGINKASDKADDTEENKAENRTTNRSVLARELAEKLGSVDDDFFGAATDFEAPIDAEDEILWQANKLDVTATTTGTINSIGAEIAGTAGSDRTLFDKGSDLIQKLANKRDKFDNWLKGSKLTDTVNGSNESNKEADDKNLGGKGGFRLSAAGSAAINKGISDTAATVDGINIEKNEAANSSLTEVAVSATDNTFLGSFAGGAAYNALKKNESPSVAIGGAVGYVNAARTVDSLIMNTQIEGAGSVSNTAEKSGTEVASGLALGVNSSSGSNLTASGSVSYNNVNNNVRAMMLGTDVNKNFEGTTKTNITNTATASNWQLAGGLAANWTGSDGTSVNLGGSVSISDLSNNLVSMISGGEYKKIDAFYVEAAKSINHLNVAVAGSKGGGKSAIGLDGAVAYNEINNNVQAAVRNGTQIDASGDVSLIAHDKEIEKPKTDAKKEELKANGIDVNNITDKYVATAAKKTINNEAVVDENNNKEIKENTDNNANTTIPGSSLVLNVAAGINLSGNGAGVGVGIDDIKNNLSVDITGATLKGASIYTTTTNQTKIVGTAAGASIGSNYFGGAGGISWHNVTNNNKVNITDSSLSANAVSALADNKSSIVSVAGQFNASTNVGVGMTFANNDMNNTTGVYVKGGEIKFGANESDGTLDLNAKNNTYVLAIGAGVGASKFNLNGAVAVNEGSNSSEAIISKGQKGTEIVNVKGLKVNAENTTSKTTIAGGLNISVGGVAGIGGGVAYANIGKKNQRETTQALIKDAVINAPKDNTAQMDVLANDKSRATTVGVGVGIEGSVNLQGGVARTNVYKDVNAGMENTSVNEKKAANQEVNSSAILNIKATSDINNKTAGAALATAFSGVLAGGVGLSFNDVDQNTKAFYNYLNTPAAQASNLYNLDINSTSNTKLLGIGIGLAGANTFAIGGSYSYNNIRGNTTAEMNKTNIISSNNIGVVAQSDDAISSIAGVIAGGAGGGFGVSVANNQITGDTLAAVKDGKLVTWTSDSENAAEFEKYKISVNNGMKSADKNKSDGIISGSVSRATFDPSLLKSARTNSKLSGLVVDSSSTHAIAADVLTGAGGAVAGVAGTFNENYISGNTKTSLNDTSVNEGADIDKYKNVSVKASDYNNIGSFEMGAAGGGNIGFGGNQNSNILGRSVLAESDSKKTTNVKAYNFDLQALSKQGISNLAVAGGLAVEGAALNANLINDDLDMRVSAKVNNLNLAYEKNANVWAENESRIYMDTYGVSLSGIGASAGFGINLLEQETVVAASVSNSTLSDNDGSQMDDAVAEVKARNNTIQNAALLSGGVAGLGASLNGTVNYNKHTADVSVSIDKAKIESGEIKVSSYDTIKADYSNDAAQVGLLGGAGVNSAITTIADKSNINISNKSELSARKGVSVDVGIDRDIDTSMLNLSLGGVAAGVNHINTSINTSITADKELQDKISTANAQDKNNTGSFVGMSASERQKSRERTAFKIDTNLKGTASGANLSVTGSSINAAGGMLHIDATEKNRLNLNAKGASVGLGAFVVTHATANVKNTANVNFDSATLYGQNVEILANTVDKQRDNNDKKPGIYTQGAVGTLGTKIAANAINSTVETSGTTGINVKNTHITTEGDMNINAKNAITANTNVYGVAAGTASVNAINTGITNTSAVAVNIENTDASKTYSINTTKSDGKININAIKTGNFTANSTGIAAGLASAGWNSTYVKDSSTSQINIKGKNYLFEADALSFQTANAPKLKTDIDNHAAAVVTGMASKATVEANSSALINVADDNFFSAGSVFFGAQVGKKDEITAASKLRSVAVAGMAVPGYSGDESNITTKTNAAVNIGKEDYSYTINNNANNNNENNSENEDNTRYATLTIDATNMTSRQNDISNVTVSGLKFAAGGIKGTTRAEDLVSTTAGGGDVNKLVMGATGNSYTDSYVRGSGGGLMDYGTNAKAITYFDNSATANIYGKWFAQDNVYVNAKQFDSMDTQTFSASGGVLQGSGVYTSLNIGDKGRITSANIANGADITANKVYVGAENNINTNKNNKYSSRLDITAGNALGMSVLESKDVIKKGTQVNIGNNVKVTTVGTQEYEALNKDALKNYATGLNAGIAESIVVQSRTDYTSANKVTLGTGATLTSNGSYDVAGVTLAASDDINSTVHAEGKVAGGAGAGPTAITEHKINRSNAVEVKGTIKSNKDINLYAGADNNGSKSNVKQLTIADAHNDTAIPLGWRRDLIVENRRNNSVQVESGAIGEALRNINIKAANGTENILKQASYHTIYGGEGGDGKAIPVVKTASDGNVNVDRFVNESTNYAKVDGSLLAGFQDKINVTITGQVVPKDLLGHNDIADVNDATKIVETHDVTAKGNNPSYTISIVDDEGRHYTELEKAAKQYTGSYANVLAERWNELNKLISAYNGENGKGGDGQTAIAYAGYMAEMQLLEAKLNSLGLMEEKVVDGKTVKVPVTEGYDIPIVALPGLMEASGGTINVDANNFYGKGSVVAKTNPEVKVENKSNAYLVVNDITIKDKGQGVIYRDNIIKSDADGKNQIKQLNSDKKYDVSYSKLKSGTEGNTGVNILSENPSLSGITLTDKVTKDGKINYVNSVFNGVGAIEIAGHVNAGTTDVTITNKNKTGGDIIINGSGTKATGIDGHSIRLTAQYGSVNQSYTKGVVNVGSTPQEVYKSANDAAINTIKDAFWLNNYTEKKHNELSYTSPAAQTDSEKAAAKSGRIAGSSIFIAADAINVNGILQSGYGKYTAVITEEQLNAAKTAAKNQDFSKSKLFEGRRIYMVNEGGTDWEAERATDGSLIYNVQIFYDPDNDTLLAEDIDAQGGKVYLAGRIISTTGGKIFAVDGGADINIDNQTNASMQLGKVLNNNINGEVTLTTISLDNNGKEVVTTKKYTTEGVTTSTGFNPGVLNTAGAGRSYTFNPEANSRYNWTVGSESTTNTHYYYRDTSILHLDFATFESETGKAKKTVTVNDAKPLPNGIFVSKGTGPDYKIVADNVVLKNQRLNYNVTSKNKVLWKNYYYNWDVKTGSSQTYVSSIKADKDIEIKFIGQDKGTINLKSGGDITLNGNIRNNNVEGTIDITSNKGALKANNGVSILGNKISLNAQKDIANINIETLDKETAVQLGAITRDGNIGINVTGNTEISTIEAKGTGDPMAGNNNVKLEVSGNIEQIAGEGIIGQRIDITSQSGGIGNLDQALKVRAGQQALNNDPLSASVNATAQKDIFLVQNTTGNNKDNDMRIGVIRSVGGNVTLTNEHGSFEDALPYTGEEASDETTARIQRWIDSGLIAGPDRNNAYIRKLEKNVSDYEHDVKESFADYEQMKALHDDLVAKYPDNYNEKWVENYSEEYRLAYESLRSEYEHYTDSDDYLDHLAADTNSDYAKLKAAAANPTYKWTQDELLYALRSEMVNKEVGSTDSRDKIANISGKNVTLYGKNIGSNETPQSITFDQLKNGYSAGGKTNVDYLKILANSDASDVIRLKDENGKDYFRVTGTAPVGINATGTVTATATAEDISMSGRKATDDGAASVLKIGEVQADKGFVRILGKEGIENALTDQAYTNVIAGKDILLEGGEGAIGSENKPITVQAIGETTGDLSARSNKNIYIKNNGLNPLSVGSIYTPDSVTLYAGNGLVGCKTSTDGVIPYINAQNLYLNGINGDSRSDLGTAERPLYVLGNSVNIQATGNSAHLKGVKYDPDNIVLGAIDMKEDFVLNTAGTITVSNKAAAKKITLSGDKGIVMSEAEKEDTAESYINGTEEVNLKASEGDIGSKDNALRLLNNGGKISVAGANGYLIGLERSNLNTADNMTLGAVGTEDSAGITGDLWVKSQGNLTTNEVINVGGALTLLANKNIDTKGILTSGGDVKVKASDIKLEKNVDTSGNINVDGKNITTEGTLTSNEAVNLTATENVQANGLTAGADVAINAIAVTLSGEVGATKNIGITATGDITTTKAITAGNNITATGNKITSSTWTATKGNITEDAVNITANGKLEAGTAVTLNANEAVNTKDAVNAGTDVTVNAATIELGKAVEAGGSIAAEGKKITAEGNLTAKKAITLNATEAVTTNETLEAGTDVAITATGDIDTAKAITAGNNITLTGKDINSSGNWTANNGNITVEGKNIANNDGLLSATKAVNLTATENVEVKDVSAGTDVAVKATTITLTGDVGASNNVGITATGDVNTKAITAGNNLTVKGADINASGNWTATSGNISAEGKNITTNGQLSADKAVILTGTERVNAKESLTSGADVTVKAVTVELEKAVDAGGNIKATGKDITTGGQLSADKAVTLDATGVVAAKGLSAGTDVVVNGATVNLEDTVNATNNVNINAIGDITSSAVITAGNNLTVNGADINASGNWTASDGNITAKGKNITNNDGLLSATKAVNLTATENVEVKDLTAGTDAAINGAAVKLSGEVGANNNVDISATGDITAKNITAGNDLTVKGADITTSGDWKTNSGNIKAEGTNIKNEAGQLIASKAVTLTATEAVNTKGSVAAGTDVTIKATTIELENTVDAGGNINANGKNITTEGQLTAHKAVTLTATEAVDAQGGAVAGTDVAIKATNINLTGEVSANNNVGITATEAITSTKAITAGNDITMTGVSIDASDNWFATNGNIIAEGTDVTTGGQLAAGKSVTLTATNNVDAQGGAVAGTDVAIKATNINLTGEVSANNNVGITATEAITSTKAITAGNDITMTGVSIDASDNWLATNGNIIAKGTDVTTGGQLAAGKSVTLTATNNVDAQGGAVAGTDVAIKATNINLTGEVSANNNVGITATEDITAKAITAGNNLTVNGADITTSGDWKARTGNITANADNITVDGKLESGKAITLTADEALDAKGGMKAGTNATVTADTIKLNGAVEATDNIELEAARTITSTGDWTTTNGNITADGTQITAKGNISSGKDLKLNTSGGEMEITGNIAAKENVKASTENGALTVDGKVSAENGSVNLLTGFDEYNNTNSSIVVTGSILAGQDVYAYSKNADIIVSDLGSNANAIEAGRDISVKTSGAGNIALLGSLNAINNIEAELINHNGDITVGNIEDSDLESMTAGNNINLSTNVGTIYIYGHTQAINGNVAMKAANETYDPNAGENNFVIKDRGSVEAEKNISLEGRNGDISIEEYLKAKGGLQAKIEGQGNLSFGTDIEVTNDIELSTEKGNVEVGKKVKSTDGNISITTGQGAIHVGSQGATEDAIAAKGNINLETKEGKVTVQGHTRSTNGDVTVSAYASEYQAGESSIIIEQNGKVISDGGGVTINSGNGDFHITDTVNANTTLTVNTVNKGSMYFDKDIEVTGDINAKVDEGDVYIGNSVTSTGGSINVSVIKGNIDVGDNDADVETITANQNVNIETGTGKITVYGKTSTQEGDISLSAGSEAYIPGEDGLNIIIDHNGLVDSARDVKLTTRNGDLHITENIISKRNTDANVPGKGSIYFDKDMVSEGDLVTQIDEGSIYTRDMKAKGDVIVSIKKGDLVLNSAEGNHVEILLGDNTDASRINTIRAKANGDGNTDVVLSGKYVQVGTVENTGGSGSPLTMTVQTPDGQNLVETFTIDKLSSNTGTKVSKLWTNNGYVNVDKGAVDISDALVGNKFTVNNSTTNMAIYGRTPTHDGEQLVYWNDASKLYPMGRRYQLFEDGGIITDNAHLVEAHDWRLLRSNKYTETYSVVDMMRNNLMRKEHYYKEVPLSMFIPKAPRQWVEVSGEIVNSIITKNASEQEITIE